MNRRNFIKATSIALAGLSLSAREGKEMSKTSLVAQAQNWSELPALLQKYKELNGDDVARIFGYGSLIWNHGDIKFGKSDALENEHANVAGATVDMNLLANGPNEFRGSDVSTGLYIGMSITDNAKEVVNGLNVTIDPSELPAAVISVASRELGKVPEGLDVTKLFAKDGVEHFAQFKGREEDALKLYTIQIIETEVNGEKKFALTTSANTKSIFYANDVSTLEAAHYVLDGHGYARNVSETSRLGGTALQYFTNQINGFRERGINHPRIEAIAKDVYRLAEFYSRHEDLPRDENGKVDLEQLQSLLKEIPVEKETAGLKVSSLKSKIFIEKTPELAKINPDYKFTSFVDRVKVPAEEKAAQSNIPRTADAKLSGIAKAFKKGDFDFLAPELVGQKVSLSR